MQRTDSYPEYDGIVAQHGVEMAERVGTMINAGHTGMMASINQLSQNAGELSLVVLANLLGRMAMENTILVRALQIMDPEANRDDAIGPDEFSAALILASEQLQAETDAARAAEAQVVEGEFTEVTGEPLTEAEQAEMGELADAGLGLPPAAETNAND